MLKNRRVRNQAKSPGALIVPLIGGFLTFLVSSMSAWLALKFSRGMLSFFEQLTEKKVNLSALGNAYVIAAALVLFTLVTGVLSGAYPPSILTSKRIARARWNFKFAVSEKEFLRNGLVVFQIVTSMVLMICGD